MVFGLFCAFALYSIAFGGLLLLFWGCVRVKSALWVWGWDLRVGGGLGWVGWGEEFVLYGVLVIESLFCFFRWVFWLVLWVSCLVFCGGVFIVSGVFFFCC